MQCDFYPGLHSARTCLVPKPEEEEEDFGLYLFGPWNEAKHESLMVYGPFCDYVIQFRTRYPVSCGSGSGLRN